MAKNNSIGSLFIDIQARTAKLEQDLGKVRKVLEGTAKDVQQVSKNTTILGDNGEVKFLKFVTAAFGAQSAIRVVAREFRHVYDNIERIRGIDPQVLGSVLALRSGISDARNEIDKVIAKGLAGFADWGTALGITAANFANVREGLSVEGLPVQTQYTADLDAQQRAVDIHYDEKLVELQRQIGEARNKARIAAQSQAEQVAELTRLSQQYLYTSQQENISSLQQSAFRLKGIQLEQSANEKLASMKKQLADAQQTVSNSMERGTVAVLSNREKIISLNERLFDLRNEYAFLIKQQTEYEKVNAGKVDPMNLQRQIEVTQQLGVLQAQLNTALTRQGQLYRDLGASMANNFEQAIIRGGKLRDILRDIGMDILQILVRQGITNPLADIIGGSGGILAGIFGGHAMGGPLDGPTMVGEKGPELLVPSSGGQTIIPNEQLRGGGGGKTFIIDARGADRSGLDNLYALIRSINGSIEQRAVNAVINRNRRRPGGQF
jgi:hypothetical protein